jgi:hypothetical protein
MVGFFDLNDKFHFRIRFSKFDLIQIFIPMKCPIK